jgi:NarL family two-component system response regulator YdfI
LYAQPLVTLETSTSPRIKSYNQHEVEKLIQVMIITPSVAARAGLRALLSEDPLVSVVAEGSSLAGLGESQSNADVLVWLPGSASDLDTGLASLEQSGLDETAALLLVYDDPAVLDSLVRVQVKVWGLVSSEASEPELIAAVQALNEGLAVIHSPWISQLTSTAVNRMSGNQKDTEELTGRELEILGLLALGLTNKQIAVKLKISAHTVKFHVSTIFSKLGTTNRVETVNLGLKKGLIVL